ncbi:CUB and sushi domain-containing protein 3-like [Bolinopsis microptera]|uniref:CUB and sushi domain-containing protein 3-like n=1 Tax=Bolinopsis microptera TaxID=2820187 RepID=UPI00307A3ECE
MGNITAQESSDDGWTAVTVRGITSEPIPFPLESTSLEIRTDSRLGSYSAVWVYFYDTSERPSGGVAILFLSTKYQYWLYYCSSSRIDFPVTLPSTTDKIWRITLTRSSGVRVVIHCNNEEVGNVLLSDTLCSDSTLEGTWGDYWNRETEYIKFERNEASDYYREAKTDKCDVGTVRDGAQCRKCDPGFQPDLPQSACGPCPAGSYKNFDMDTCAECPDNTISTIEGAVLCIPCGDGKQRNLDGTECEHCKSEDLAIENGVMTVHNEATTPYEQGVKVSYKCNDRFKLVGNSELTCNNRAWSNAAPLCKPVNAMCPSYEVINGKVMDESSGPFLTTESVSAICELAYNLNGTNPRVCAEAGWKTDAQNCVYKEGRCPPLKHLEHGGLSCNGGYTYIIKSSCTVSCDPGYIYLSEIKKVTCQEDLRWSHQSFTNSQGNFAACAKQETPKSHVLEVELYLDVDYCKTDPEKAAVVAAFETYIHSGSAAVPCVTGAKCTVQNTSCKNGDGSSVVSFELLQYGDLSSEDASTLTSSDSRLKELVTAEAMTFEVTTSKKRATTRFTAEDGSYTGNVKTACEAGFAQISGSCITCPAGYHIPGGYICNACAVGTYSTAPNSVGCEKCTSGSTTYGKGSTSSGDCKELCKVPGVTHGSMSPPTGYNVDPNTLIKMTCDNGSVLHTGEEKFKCSTGIVPTCKEDGDKVSDGGGSTTVIIVVVVAVLVMLAAVVIAAFFIRKRYLYSSDQNHAVRKTDNKAPVSGNNEVSKNVYDTAETQNI